MSSVGNHVREGPGAAWAEALDGASQSRTSRAASDQPVLCPVRRRRLAGRRHFDCVTSGCLLDQRRPGGTSAPRAGLVSEQPFAGARSMAATASSQFARLPSDFRVPHVARRPQRQDPI